VAIHIQPLQGWLEPLVLPQVSPVAIHIQPLQGWLGPLVLPPQVFLKAIISRSELLRFIFNPFGVGASGTHFPQVPPGAIHIQPLRGWRVGYTFSPGSTWGYSHSTPTGLAWI